MSYLLLFYCNNGCTNAPQCYFIRTLPALLVSYRPRPCSPVPAYQRFWIACCLHLHCYKHKVEGSTVSQHTQSQLKHTISVSFVKHKAMMEYENIRSRTTIQRIPNFNTTQTWEQNHETAVRPWGTRPQNVMLMYVPVIQHQCEVTYRSRD